MGSKYSAGADKVAAEAVARYKSWLGDGRPAPYDGPVHLTAAQIAKTIDHTQLKPDAGERSFRELCAEAMEYGFASVCVQPSWVATCADLLKDTDVDVCAVAGFPQGMNVTSTKAYEARRAIEDGAIEIDMVIHVGRLKDGDYAYVAEDIGAVAEACHDNGAVLKTIVETCLLSDDEKAIACALAVSAGADFVKTSTGFNGPGANIADVALMRHIVGPEIGVKAAGGIRTYDDFVAMVQAGASRIGASAGVQIVQGAKR